MRIRYKKWARPELEASKFYIDNPENWKGNWSSFFANPDNPLHLELGCGKGQFMSTLAKLNPDINYIAIEKFDSVLLRCLEKIINDDIPNLKIAVMDAAVLGTYFADDEVDRIYLNFSDPWPKSHHAKRRLTSPLFLDLYKHVLKDEGEIHFKTDNRGLFEYSLESFNNNGFKLSHISLDLHMDTEKYPDNITTEFEDKWSKLGPIYRLEAKVK